MAKNATPAAPSAAEIDDDAYYEVSAARRFHFEGVGFGQLAATEVRGALLRRLLASEHAAAVKGFVPTERADAP